jgi:hypothetical protein
MMHIKLEKLDREQERLFSEQGRLNSDQERLHVQCTVSRRACKTSRSGGQASSYVSAVRGCGWILVASSTDEAGKSGPRAGEAGQ